MIGIFGGAFDPIHYGHLRAALEVREALSMDALRLLPLNVAVHRAQPLAGNDLRLDMVRAAVEGEPGMIADDRELRRAGGSYTVDTLTDIRSEIGQERPLCLLVGGDAFNAFFEWHRPRDILELAHLAVMRRPGSPLPRDPQLREALEHRQAQAPEDLHAVPAGRIWLQAVTQLDISSTRIRRAIGVGQSARFLLPDAVLDMATAAGCYAGAGDAAGRADPTFGSREEADSTSSTAQRGNDAA